MATNHPYFRQRCVSATPSIEPAQRRTGGIPEWKYFRPATESSESEQVGNVTAFKPVTAA
jgi:hypothetical protein